MNTNKNWILRAGAAAVLLALLFLAGSCNPFNPLAAAGMVDLRIYWLTFNKIFKANLDGTGIEQIYSGSGGPAYNAIAIDKLNGKIYWSDTMMMNIYRANLDGSMVQSIAAIGTPDLALDIAGGKLYFVSGADILRCNLDGTGMESFGTGYTPSAIALDLAHGTIYWSSGNTIRQSTISSPGSSTQIYPSAETINEIALDVAGGKIYWIEIPSYQLRQANLDGTGLRTVATSVNGWGLDVDPHENKIYWTQDTGMAPGDTLIKRINSDGSGLATIITDTGLDQAYGLVLDLWP